MQNSEEVATWLMLPQAELLAAKAHSIKIRNYLHAKIIIQAGESLEFFIQGGCEAQCLNIFKKKINGFRGSEVV